MAAYHWEARRKQIIMEHRLRLMQESRPSEESQQQVSKEKTSSSTALLCSSTTSQNLPQKEVTQEDRCLCQTEHIPSQSGKLLKRYKENPGCYESFKCTLKPCGVKVMRKGNRLHTTVVTTIELKTVWRNVVL